MIISLVFRCVDLHIIIGCPGRPNHHASAEACLTGWSKRNPREGSVARHYQDNLMICVVCSCCVTSPYREVCRAKGGIGRGETLCYDIYPLGI